MNQFDSLNLKKKMINVLVLILHIDACLQLDYYFGLDNFSLSLDHAIDYSQRFVYQTLRESHSSR